MAEQDDQITPSSDETTPIEPLVLPDAAPAAEAPASPAAPATAGKGKRYALIGAAAAGLVIVAGAAGFAIGQTGDSHKGQAQLTSEGRGFDQQQGQGQQGQGLQGQQGQGRGVDPDGDNWTGGGMMGDRHHGMMGDGQQGFGGQQGQPGQGVDPDGDNWTGSNRQGQQGQMPGLGGLTSQQLQQWLQDNGIDPQEFMQQFGQMMGDHQLTTPQGQQS